MLNDSTFLFNFTLVSLARSESGVFIEYYRFLRPLINVGSHNVCAQRFLTGRNMLLFFLTVALALACVHLTLV